MKDFSVELQDGTILQKEDFEREFVRTIGFVKLEKRANDLVERLGKAARCT